MVSGRISTTQSLENSALTRSIAGENRSLYGNYSHLWVVKRTEREVELNREKVVVCARKERGESWTFYDGKSGNFQ